MFSNVTFVKKAGFDVVECYNQLNFQIGILNSAQFYQNGDLGREQEYRRTGLSSFKAGH